ncbi:MAG: nucleotide-binding universal stress UspA family protein, partial [Kiritimatiellia bacterium]
MVPYNNIVVGIDFSECAWDAVNHALSLAQLHDSRVILVHATQMPSGLSGKTMVRSGSSEVRVPAESTLRTESIELMAKYKSRLTDAKVAVQLHIEPGSAAKIVVKAATDYHADLIITGAHGRTGLAKAWHGSVSEQIHSTSPCPVLTIRSHERPE